MITSASASRDAVAWCASTLEATKQLSVDMAVTMIAIVTLELRREKSGGIVE